MLHNHLLLAWRNLVKRPGFSLINILGLSVGVAACIILFLYVHFEATYDGQNRNIDRIARITATMQTPESNLVLATCPLGIGTALQQAFPEIAAVTRLHPAKSVVRFNNTPITEPRFYETDQAVFSIFTFSFLEGSAPGSLSGPHSIVLTARARKKYFGDGTALGKTLICYGQPLKVTGVVEDQPANTDMPVDALISRDFSKITDYVNDDFSAYTFVLFHQKTDLKKFESRLKDFSNKYVQPQLEKAASKDYHFWFKADALRDVHFTEGKLEDMPKGNRMFNYIFSLLAIFILLIALLNYINLSTAKATDRAKEVGVRKVNGAGRPELIRQFLLESFLLVTIAWVIALGLVWIGLPFFNRILQIELSYTWQGSLWWPLLTFVGTVLMAGLYPAFILSSFQPSEVLKGSWRQTGKGLLTRKIITVTQFTITIALVAGATVIYSQMHFIMHTDPGFDVSHVIALNTPTGPENKGINTAFVQALKESPFIEGISAGSGLSQMSIGTTYAANNGKKEEFMCNCLQVDPAFLSLMGIPLSTGRNLSDSLETDKTAGFLVNRAFVRKMRWKDPIGQDMEGFGHKGKVIGVVGDFHYESLHNVIQPLLMVYHQDGIPVVSVKMQVKDLPRAKQVWQKFYPELPFDYTIVEDSLNSEYTDDRVTMNLFNAFTLLAIAVSCLGLYGLISITVVYRTKEIGVRKVLGASLDRLVVLLVKDSLALIVLAACLALPLAGIAMQRWLATYAYHVPLTWWMFVSPLGLVLFIALSVTATKVIRAAQASPVKSLKTE